MKLVETNFRGEVLRQMTNSVQEGMSAEQQAQNLYEYHGYNVKNLERYSDIEGTIDNKYLSAHNLDNSFVKKGVPDLIVYDEEELLFVEVKKGNNGVTYTQLRWNREFDYETRILWVMDEGFDYSKNTEKPDYDNRIKKDTVKQHILEALETTEGKTKQDLYSEDSIVAQRKDLIDDILKELILEKKIIANKNNFSGDVNFRSLISEYYREKEGQHTRSELLGKIEILYDELGKPEKFQLQDFMENTPHGASTINKYFGGWKRAKMLANVEEPEVPEELL